MKTGVFYTNSVWSWKKEEYRMRHPGERFPLKDQLDLPVNQYLFQKGCKCFLHTLSSAAGFGLACSSAAAAVAPFQGRVPELTSFYERSIAFLGEPFGAEVYLLFCAASFAVAVCLMYYRPRY